MKAKTRILFHQLRASWHWNRMKRIAAATEASHIVLMQCHGRYKESSNKYNESIALLVAEGQYQTAISLIADKSLRAVGNAQ